MSAVYIQGSGLASSLGHSLAAALQNLTVPPAPRLRSIAGCETAFPFYAIKDAGTDRRWFARCITLLQDVIAEAGASADMPLYLASSSLQIGEIERGEIHAEAVPDFLARLQRALGWQAPLYWISTACTSAHNALLAAQRAILASQCEAALVIGLELENRLSLAGFAAMQLLSPDGARPFAPDRNGLVLGEAVAAIHLGTQPARWQLCGGAHVIDSAQASGASTAAYARMLQQTLTSAGWRVNEVDLIKVQAAGSPANDEVEAAAMQAFFPTLPPLLSLKTLIGHTLGASGAAELALLLAMLDHGRWPAMPQNAAQLVPLSPACPTECRQILSTILGFGGSHSCLALRQNQ